MVKLRLQLKDYWKTQNSDEDYVDALLNVDIQQREWAPNVGWWINSEYSNIGFSFDLTLFQRDFDKQFAEYSDKPVGMCFYYQDVYDCDTTTDEWIQRGN